MDRDELVSRLLALPGELEKAQAEALKGITDYRMAELDQMAAEEAFMVQHTSEKGVRPRLRDATLAAKRGEAGETLVGLKTGGDAAKNAVRVIEAEITCLQTAVALLTK